jgi:hypothetical protein
MCSVLATCVSNLGTYLAMTEGDPGENASEIYIASIIPMRGNPTTTPMEAQTMVKSP